MKCDMAKLSHGHQGSSSGTGPLFPPLHVNDTGKSGLRAPPRNKMALFEQFTLPCNSFLPPNKGVGVESASKQRGTLNTYTQYSMTATHAPAAIFNSGVNGVGKSSYGSSLGSLSTCSAVVNVDESRRFEVQELEDDTCSLSEPILGMVSGKSSNEKVFNVAKGACLSPHVDDKGQACEQAVGSVSEGFRKWNKGFITGGNQDAENLDTKVRSKQEIINNSKGLASAAGSQLFGFKTTDRRPIGNTIVSNPALSQAPNQLDSNDQCAVESAANVLEEPVVSCEGDVGSIARTLPTALCGKMESSAVPPLPAIIKPKHVIHAIGQQHFWKARKAILRQQEVFSNQVYELHKLIEVQKKLAKMPSTLVEEHLLSGTVSDRVGDDFYPSKANSKKEEISNIGAQQAPAPHWCEGQAHESRPPQRLLSLQEREGQVVVEAESKTKRSPHSSHWSQSMTNTSHGQAPYSDGISAWGYPMGSLNRPFLYPPGAGRFPHGSGLGGPYVVGSNPPMAPFTFPCYPPRPEQPAPIFYQSNQWPTPMYHNPVFSPMANDWFAMNYSGQVPLTSGSEKLGPTNSVPSINKKAEASSQSVQPAVALLSRRQQVGTSSCTKRVATKSFGPVATASVSAPPDALSGKPAGSGYMGEHNPAPNPAGGSRFMPRVWGAFGGETRLAVKVGGPLKDKKEGAQVPLCSGEERMHIYRSCENNALNLFPLQPSAGASEGQVLRRDEGSHGQIIKAIPRSALAASESAAGILRSIQKERQL